MPLRTSRITAATILVVLTAMIVPAGALAGRVDRVRYSTDSQRTRVVVDTDRALSYKITSHSNPDRIAINIPKAKSGQALKALALDNESVKRVRVNKLSWGVQIVLDLWGPAQYKHFTLARNGNKANRIVIDVFAKAGGTGLPATSSKKPGKKSTGARDFIVAIDPGHGGKDPGTSRHGLIEKKLVLDISRRIRDRINAAEGYTAFLTRDSDVFLDLPRRTKIARSKNADVFVSIHLNSAPNRGARGAEVFFVSPAGARATASRVLANPHRAAGDLGIEGEASSEVLHMLVDVNQQSMLMRSSLLAEEIVDALGRKVLPPTRGVKQKSFAVLKNISMPSVIVEAGFLSNRKDAAIIKTSKGRGVIAQAVSDGIFGYMRNNPPQRAPKSMVVHKVRSGETLWKIARKYGTSIASLRKVNRLGSSSMLRVGQELLVSRGY